MGETERKAKKRALRLRTRNILLATLAVTGAIAVSAMAPNAIRLLKYAMPSLERHFGNPSNRIGNALRRMRAQGIVRRRADGSYELTEKGGREAQRLRLFYAAKARAARRWDRRWRIVMFDVWEKRTQVRRQLRTMLKDIGFVQLQKSVWVYPYDCEDIVALMRTDLRLGRGILYFVADGAENDLDLRRHFGIA